MPLKLGARVVNVDSFLEGNQQTGVDLPQAGQAEQQYDLEDNMLLLFINLGRGVYTCPLCPLACTHFRELKAHFAKQHPTWELKAKCRPCSFTGEFHSVRCQQPLVKVWTENSVAPSVSGHSKPNWQRLMTSVTCLVGKRPKIWRITKPC